MNDDASGVKVKQTYERQMKLDKVEQKKEEAVKIKWLNVSEGGRTESPGPAEPDKPVKTDGTSEAAEEERSAEGSVYGNIREAAGRYAERAKAACSRASEKIAGMYGHLHTRSDTHVIKKAASLAVMLLIAVMAFTAKQPAGLSRTAYAASASRDAAVYVIGKPLQPDGTAGKSAAAVEIKRIVRGTGVLRCAKTVTLDGVTYVKVEENGAEPVPAAASGDFKENTAAVPDKYMRADELAAAPDAVVRETEVYVRTPSTIYADAEGPAIASFAQKGSCLRVTGYDRINADGSVNKYRVEYTAADGEPAGGYVYGKYMTDTQEKADAVYNGNGIYDKAVSDNYGMELYGGKAADLDYYPYEKPSFEGNGFCSRARAMYLNCAAAVNPEEYIDIIEQTDCNAVVVDIKDGVLAYRSEVARELSPRSYDTAYVSAEEYKAGIDALKASGVYVIGRIVVFNDPIYAEDHPENCIIWGENTGWPSAYSREVWEYNVRLAREAVGLFGFNEIQFDYVRFPENSYEMSESGLAEFHNVYGEEKGQAVQNFCFYAADQIHEAGAYFSVDVFGESAYGYMTAYGQYWAGISNIVDAISAMPYTDHMGAEGSWEDPYGTMKSWAAKAAAQQACLEHPAAARTWITGYDTPHWNPVVNYGKKKLRKQVKALDEEGLTGGFIPWNAASSLEKYRQYKKVWNE